MKKSRSFLFLCCLIIIGAASVYAADVAKIGVVDFQRILRESKAGKAAARELREKQEQRSEDLKTRRQDIVALQKYIEGVELTGDKADRDQKKLELTIKLDDFKDADTAYNNQLKEINAKQTADIRETVYQVIEGIGRKGGYLLIVETNDVLYSPAANDITSRVIEEYDRVYQEKQ